MDEEGEGEVAARRWLLCDICLIMTPEDLPHGRPQWVRACLCPSPVHRRCALHYVWARELRLPSRAPACLQCGSLYRVRPTKDPVLVILELFFYHWYPCFCKVVACLTEQAAIDAATTTFGFLVLDHVYGSDAAQALVQELDPLVAVALCQSIPLASITINVFPWEDLVLEAMYRCSRLPVLCKVLPREDPDTPAVRPPAVTFVGMVVGGLMLPHLAKVTGEVFFSWEPSDLRRVLLGGVFFLAVRGVLYMYYRHSIYVRQHSLTVANYTPQHS